MDMWSVVRKRNQLQSLKVGSIAGEDGDFVQLRVVRERRKHEDEDQASSAANDTAPLLPQGIVKSKSGDMKGQLSEDEPDSATDPGTMNDIREQLFEAVDKDDTQLLQAAISSARSTLAEDISNIKDPITDQNVLHYAMKQKKRNAAKYLMNLGNIDLILSSHDVQQSLLHGKNNSLHIATEHNDMEFAKHILDSVSLNDNKLKLMKQYTSVGINGQRPRLFTCLHLAAYHGHSELVKLYIESGMSVNHQNGKKDTALLWASRWGKTDTVNLLLDLGANPNLGNDKGSTPLYWAIRYEHIETVKLLLQKGKANPNTKRKLGLVAPIILASAYGNTDILSTLLDHPDIVLNTKIRGGEMAIHHAAMEGCVGALILLLDKGVEVDAQDDIGDTPLLLAAKSGHVQTVNELIKRKANINHRNHEGNNVWNYAMEADGNSLLHILVLASRGKEEPGRPPICVAASYGSCDKIQFLLDINTDPLTVDNEENTFLHHAAMADKYEVINKFHEIIPVDCKSNTANTPLHIACSRGYPLTIKSLLQCKARADLKNNKGRTALHLAAHSRHIKASTVRALVDYTIKTHAWESLNTKDYLGNNCLHIAGKFAKPDVLWEFRFVRFKDRDQDGLTPLHEAVRPDEPEALNMMLNIFEEMKRDARLNEQTYATGETVMHLAADEGNAECVKRLIELGADISVKDSNGNTVLHRLTKLISKESPNTSKHQEVFDTICDNIVRWWCIKKNLSYPEEDNRDEYFEMKRTAMLYVSNESFNNSGLSVLDKAFKTGASSVLSRLLMMPGVTMFEEGQAYKFDINSLTPKTENLPQGCCGTRTIATAKDDASKGEFDNGLSGLEWLLSQTVKSRATEILNIPPVRKIEQYYASIVSRTFAVLMVLHITYMTIFTYVGLNLLAKLRKNESSINSSDTQTVLMYVFVPIEPLLILVYTVFTVVRYIVSGEIHKRAKLSRKKGIQKYLSLFTSYSFLIFCVSFAALVTLWLILFACRYSYQDNFLAAALIVGWLLTISFTRGIRLIHYFYRMLMSMLIRDIVRFLFVYLFVLMAFGFAFHAMFQVSDDLVSSYGSAGDTLFLTFNMMIGMGELFDGSVETSLATLGRSAVFMKVVYLLYMVLGTIVLLNLLIAMMSDSYTMILQENQVMWRIESVSLGVEIEATFPFIHKISTVAFMRGKLGSSETDQNAERWHVEMTEEEFLEYMNDITDMKDDDDRDQDVVVKRLQELEERTESIQEQQTQNMKQITTMLEQILQKQTNQ